MLVRFKAESFTRNGYYQTDHNAIPSNARISLLFRFYFKAESFTWTAPPPVWTPTTESDVRTVKISVLNGSTSVALRWNYTLGINELLFTTIWKLDGTRIAAIAAVTVIDDNRFDLHKSEVATLIIKDVSEMEDVTIQCEVQTSLGSWKYNIRLEIIGERQINLILFDRVCIACFQLWVGRGNFS